MTHSPTGDRSPPRGRPFLHLVCAMLFPVLLGPVGCGFPPGESQEGTESQRELARFREKHAALQQLILDLEEERREKIDELRRLGVESADDLGGNSRAEVVATELQAVRRRLEHYTRTFGEYELALLKLTAAVREQERSRAAREAGIDPGDVEDIVSAFAAFELEFEGNAESANLPAAWRLEELLAEELSHPIPRPLNPSITRGTVQAQYHKGLSAESPPEPTAEESRREGLRLAAEESWSEALPLLASGDDPLLAAAARRDAANPQRAEDQLIVADAWRTLAAEPAHPTEAFQRRAREWYRRALPGLPAEAREEVEPRLAEP